MFKLSDYRKSQIIQWVTRLLKYNPPVQIHEVERKIQVLRVQMEVSKNLWLSEKGFRDHIAKTLASKVGDQIYKENLITIGAFSGVQPFNPSLEDKFIVEMKVEVVPPIKGY